ncbi:hypothetical protein [Methylocystis bryophila]|uniref:Uncharacterized protein n=1 Tax=Methylocystis bryophila TaxID=655015 RepID=A0A1W6MZU1_9HYPH|nr:hypothetical protein [Methylocystis bryophila]ARN83066.1 hypothetical protein B1812_20485 [Methylocystis bryophila]BDV39378.1 hypothetical protein DSM21852_26310 [Methylocystis bryophila]
MPDARCSRQSGRTSTGRAPQEAQRKRRARMGAEPSTLRKLTLGCLGLAASYLILAFAAAIVEAAQAPLRRMLSV